jgi:two-component system chemotaxis response regulator CheB
VLQRDVIVIGASTGGVEALSTLVAGLPDDFPAAVFVVIHISEDTPSHLPTILNRVGSLAVGHAVDREPIRRGRIYVAPPGLQTAVENGRIGVRRGPRENMHRPSVDVLFRTAAHHYGPRVIGVILTGSMDDGAEGLAAVKRGGGIAIVQDPSQARASSMPAHALERTDVDYVVELNAVAPLLCALVDNAGSELPSEVPLSSARAVPLETVEEAGPHDEARRSDQLGPPSMFTCPECHGTLFEIHDGRVVRFRCRVGHAYSEDSIVVAQNDSAERALWAALRALEEREGIMRRLSERARGRGWTRIADRFDERARRVHQDVETIHDLVVDGRALEPVAVDEQD